MKKKNYFSLFLSFFKIGLFTFGGGYAMIALFDREFVDKHKWIDHDEFMDVVAIAESTPGPIAVNSATYIGYRVAGVFGAAVSTFAVCLPSFVIIYCISLVLDAFLALEYVGYAFQGIQVCVAYLIITAGLRMLKKMKKNTFRWVLFLVSLLAMTAAALFSVKVSSIVFILAGALIGVTAYIIQLAKGKNHKEDAQG